MPNDPHAQAVAVGLQRLGVKYQLVFNHLLAEHAGFALRLGSFDQRLVFAGQDVDPEAVWFRRFTRINLPQWVDPLDVRNAEGEWESSLRALRQMAGETRSFCVNPSREALSAGLKPFQLATAMKVGLNIPETLVTNLKTEVVAFERDVGQIIHKSFNLPGWVLSNGIDTWLPTTLVNASDLHERSLAACPGIFQAYVPKAYEVRATVTGREIFAVIIDSQSQPDTRVDWKGRRGSTRGILRGRIKLPGRVLQAVYDLMEALGIVFGCLDLIVREDGSWVFLEVNPQGQFLWVEKEDQTFPLLDAFVRLLISSDKNYTYSAGSCQLSLLDVIDSLPNTLWNSRNSGFRSYEDPLIAFEGAS